MGKMMRRLLALSLAALTACMLGVLCACSTETETQNEDTPEEVITTAVVYYSATGTTQTIADMIAGPNNGMLFDITPAVPYDEADLDYNDPDSRVSQERLADDHAVELKTSTVPDWDRYDTVYLGYPIWWGEAAWPMQTFVAANDFSGKKVIPFCTSASSGLGESAERLAALAGTGEWLEGGSFDAQTTQAEVNEWVASLSLGNTAAQ